MFLQDETVTLEADFVEKKNTFIFVLFCTGFQTKKFHFVFMFQTFLFLESQYEI